MTETRGLDRLGDILVRRSVLEPAELERARKQAETSGRRLGETVVSLGLAGERDVWRALAEQRGLLFMTVEELLDIADPALATIVPRSFQEHQHVVPVARRDGTLLAATCDPDRSFPGLADAAGAKQLEFVVITPTDFHRLQTALVLGQVMPDRAVTGGGDRLHDLLRDRRVDAELVRLFNAMLLDAIGEEASDLHLERYGDRVRVRIRVDGELRDLERYRLSPAQLQGLINILKISSNLDIAEHRLPQGGRFSTQAAGHVFDLRVQTQPCMHGEHAVVRLLPQDMQLISIEDLGFPDDAAVQYRRLLDSPQGLVLVVGPTGSGKSTTLYAGLQVLAADATRKVITIEDPIEYAIEGVQQTQVHTHIGFHFSHAMRAFVRQDPDVILVGEIRDGETALEAIRASQTGHLVLSTLHCNDTVDAVQRLFDLGMHPNSIASELLAVYSQRLAKRICIHCRTPHDPDPELVAEVFPAGAPDDLECFVGKGCDSCGGHGTHGRIAVVEHLPVDAALRRAISGGLALDDLRTVALRAGLRPLRRHALELVGDGVITLEELPTFLTPERLAGLDELLQCGCRFDGCTCKRPADAADTPESVPS